MEGPTEKLPRHNLSPDEDDEDGNGSDGIVVATLKVEVLCITLLKCIPPFSLPLKSSLA